VVRTGGARPLSDLLPRVSRSFALSLRLLPGRVRTPLGVTYLVARAADTIADTRILPAVRRQAQLEALRRALDEDRPVVPDLEPVGPPSGERELLERLPAILAAHRALPPEDRERARTVLLTLTAAMLEALAHFPPEDSGRLAALETRADLDRYTYMNAGCVGGFWTDVVRAHRPSCAGWDPGRMRALGIAFGQGLQLVNVLRDLPRDLRSGRCYLPRVDLAALGVRPEDLRRPGTGPRVRPLLLALGRQAREGLEAGLAYTLATPRREVRLRVATVLPLLIGLGTLGRLAGTSDLLDPAVTVKVPRSEVRSHLAAAALLATSNRGLGAYAGRLARRVAGALGPP
jgi:farnesyl-diphosphate farnesyltransferase